MRLWRTSFRAQNIGSQSDIDKNNNNNNNNNIDIDNNDNRQTTIDNWQLTTDLRLSTTWQPASSIRQPTTDYQAYTGEERSILQVWCT